MGRQDSGRLDIDDVAKPTPAETAAEQIRQWILSGQLPVGKRLPSERDLANRLGITRTAIRSGLLRLEEDGLIAGSVGRGRYVTSRPRPAEGVNTLMAGALAILVEKSFTQGRQLDLRPSGWSNAIPSGAVSAAFEKGFSALLIPADHASESQLQHLYTSPPQGLVIINDPQGLQDRDGVLAALRLKQIPVVAYGDIHEWRGCDVVCSDHRAGNRKLTQWLIDQKCRRILRLEQEKRDGLHWLEERHAGYEEACREAGIEVMEPLMPPPVVAYDFGREAFESSAHLLAGYLFKYLNGKNPVDAIMCLSDGDAPKVAAAMRILDRDPNGLKIVGYDNYWQALPERKFESYTPDATVDKNNFGIGQALVELLVERLTGSLQGPPVSRMLAPELLIIPK